MKVIAEILKREGGYFNDPLGGKTMGGITLPVYKEFCEEFKLSYSEDNLKGLTEEKLIEIYIWLFKRYKVLEINDEKVQGLYFDCCVNHGYARSVKWIQELSGANIDGFFGSNTKEKVNNTPDMFTRLLKKRIKFMVDITVSDPKNKLQFLRGWINRCLEFI